MKNQRTLLIEQAARDHADEGTEWRDRMEAWLDATNTGPFCFFDCDFVDQFRRDNPDCFLVMDWP